MYTFTMVGYTLFKFCHFKCAKAYLLEILGMSRLWHDLMAHGHTYTYFAHPIDFFALPILKKNMNLSDTVSLWYESWYWFLFAPFWNNQ